MDKRSQRGKMVAVSQVFARVVQLVPGSHTVTATPPEGSHLCLYEVTGSGGSEVGAFAPTSNTKSSDFSLALMEQGKSLLLLCFTSV